VFLPSWFTPYPRHGDQQCEAGPDTPLLVWPLLPSQLVGKRLQEASQRLELRASKQHASRYVSVHA
jgi:hypothetical protein